MNEENIAALREEGWDNCKQCGWFYKQKALDLCPMCHHDWHIPVSFKQPPYESPSLDGYTEEEK